MLGYAVIFVAIFVVSALLLSLFGLGAAEEKKQAEERIKGLISGDVAIRPDTVNQFRKTQFYSSIPVLNRWMQEMDLAATVRDLLSQGRLDWTPGRLLLMCATACIIPGLLVFLRTKALLLSVLLGGALGSVPLVYVVFKRSQRFDAFERGLPAALDLMVSALRSGHSLVSAISLVAQESPDPIGPEFRICFDEQNYGVELRIAMENLSKRVPVQSVRIIMTAILIQKETGGNLAEVLERCGQVLRERFRLKKEIQVKTAQGRLTGLILALLPVILGFLLYLVSPQQISLLWRRPLGLKMLYGASCMTLVGGLIIRRIVRVRV